MPPHTSIYTVHNLQTTSTMYRWTAWKHKRHPCKRSSTVINFTNHHQLSEIVIRLHLMRIWKVLHSLQSVNFWGWVYYIVHICNPLQANTWAAPKCQWNLDQILHRPELIVFLFFHAEGVVGLRGRGGGIVLEQCYDQNVLFHFFHGEGLVGLVFVCLFVVVVWGVGWVSGWRVIH